MLKKFVATFLVLLGIAGAISSLGLLEFVPAELVKISPFQEVVIFISFLFVISVVVSTGAVLWLNDMTEGAVMRGCALAAECVGVAFTGTLAYRPNREQRRHPHGHNEYKSPI